MAKAYTWTVWHRGSPVLVLLKTSLADFKLLAAHKISTSLNFLELANLHVNVLRN